MTTVYETTNSTLFMHGYNKFLYDHGLSNQTIAYHATLAMAYLVKQADDVPFLLEGYIAKNKALIEQHRALWEKEEPLRVLPLTPKEKELLIGTAATTGNSVPLRLRNAAMVALLLSPMPRGIRPDHVRKITVNQLWMTSGPFTSWPTLGVTEKDTVKSLKFDKDGKESQFIELDNRAQQHLSRYVMFEDGWPSIKHWGSEYLFLPIGTKGTDIGKNSRFVSRQTVWKMIRQAGINAGITGLLYPDILRKQRLSLVKHPNENRDTGWVKS